MRLGAVIILRRDDGAVLMQHRDNKPNIPYPDYWSLIGGAVNEDEEPIKAAIRELMEETGYCANQADLTHVCISSQLLNGSEICRYVFLALYDETQSIECFEGQEMRFIKQADFSDLKILEDHISFVNQVESILVGSKERRG